MTKRIDPSRGPGDGSLTHSPFAALQKTGAGDAGSGPAEHDGAAAVEPKSAQPAGGRIEVRRERKGRGGKTVTQLKWLQGKPKSSDLVALAKKIGAGLGTGARVENGDVIVLQGDLVERAVQWLESARGTASVGTPSIVRGT